MIEDLEREALAAYKAFRDASDSMRLEINPKLRGPLAKKALKLGQELGKVRAQLDLAKAIKKGEEAMAKIPLTLKCPNCCLKFVAEYPSELKAVEECNEVRCPQCRCPDAEYDPDIGEQIKLLRRSAGAKAQLCKREFKRAREEGDKDRPVDPDEPFRSLPHL